MGRGGTATDGGGFMMNKEITIALVGIGGYGNNFVTALLDAPNHRDFRIVGTVDPNPASCRRLGELKSKGVPLYPSLDAFYQSSRADLVILSSPLQFHASQTCQALEHGSHVLCEKPLCVMIEQARRMRQTRDRSGKIVAIGYQWSFSDAVQKLKADVLSGAFGKPRRLRTIVLWPRDEAYYGRNRWAGAKADAQGNLVLDSPVNNACAHYLHNMLYVLGERVDRSAEPAQITAELYRAHPIQNYDTAALRCLTQQGIELVFIVSHCTDDNRGPIFSYEFEKATVEFGEGENPKIVARFADGSRRDYGAPGDGRDNKIWQTVDAIRDGKPVVCGIEAAFAHTQCVLAAQQSSPEITAFDPSTFQKVGEIGHRKTIVKGLGETLMRCYESAKLPSEMGLAWARKATTVSVGHELKL